MPSTDAVISYLHKHHPPDSFSRRLMRLVYLCDWKSCLMHGRRMLYLDWVNTCNGPLSLDVRKAPPPRVMPSASLTEEDRDVLDFVLAFSAKRQSTDAQFSLTVRSTYPLITTSCGTSLDLLPLSQEYLERRGLLFDTFRDLSPPTPS